MVSTRGRRDPGGDGLAAPHREALARELGVTGPTVAARLDGQIPFDLVELERVAGWLGLAPSELVARADERAA